MGFFINKHLDYPEENADRKTKENI